MFHPQMTTAEQRQMEVDRLRAQTQAYTRQPTNRLVNRPIVQEDDADTVTDSMWRDAFTPNRLDQDPEFIDVDDLAVGDSE